MFSMVRAWFGRKARKTVFTGDGQETRYDFVKEVELMRLTPEVYAQFAKQLPAPSCPTTDLEAGYMLGIQVALQKLRDGFVMVR